MTVLDADQRRRLIDVATGAAAADAVLMNARLINMLTCEILLSDIAIKDGYIAVVAPHGERTWSALKTCDLEGRFVSPGFMDPHVHIESSFVTVAEYARAAIARGTTMVAIDPHEMGNVLGVAGMALMMEEARTTPMRIRMRVPGRIPAMPPWLETSGASLDVAETIQLLDGPYAICLAGDINPFLLIGKDKDQLAKIDATRARKMTVSGQSPGLRGAELAAYVAAGPEDTHAAASLEEIIENQRAGLRSIIALRRALLHREHFRALARHIAETRMDTRYLQFCTDDVNAHEFHDVGHLDTRVRIAIEEGMDPFVAYQMATINVAEGLRLDPEFGAIAPGRVADLIVIGDMAKVDVEATMVGGGWVWGRFGSAAPAERFVYPEWARQTMRVGGKFVAADMQIIVEGDVAEVDVRTIVDARPKKLSDTVTLSVRDRVVLPDPGQSISSIITVDRHKASRRIGRGFVSGFFVQRGAFASTVSHDAHNLTVIGASFEDMTIAANRSVHNGGGYVIVLDGEVLFEMPLPIAGLMSDKPLAEVAAQARDLKEMLHERLGVPRVHDEVLHQINFMALPNIPDFGFTDFGLIASDSLQVMDVVIGSRSRCECRARTFAGSPADT
jgi:adenine deaminase